MKWRALLVLVLLLLASNARADSILGVNVSGFAVLGSSAVTNTGPTTITGDVGVYPDTSITGESSITLTGASVYHDADAVAGAAQADLTAAISTLALSPVTSTLTGQDLGGQTLAPGVYFFSSSAQLTGTLNLVNPSDVPGATWIFIIGTTLTTASNSVVDVNDPSGSNDGLYWLVGSSATLGTNTSFEGNILATDSITLNTGATDSCGRALASTGAVTLDNNVISIGCSATNNEGGSEGGGSNGFSGGTAPVAAVPEPNTFALLASGLIALVFLALRASRSSI